MKTNKKSRGFFASLVRSFISFALSILGIYIVLFIVNVVAIFLGFASADNIKLMGYEEKLIEGEYKEIQADLSADSNLTVYDENFDIVYKADENSYELNEYELSVIPSAEIFGTVELATLENEKGKLHTITYFDETDLKIVLDSDYNVIFSDIELDKEKLTEQEFHLLSGALNEDTAITKLTYNTNGQTMYATITHDKSISETAYTNIERMIALTGYIFPFIFIIAVLIFIIRLDKKVKQPIEILSNSIKDFSKDGNYKPIEYKGFREFREICDSFNNLTEKLQTTEAERQKSEDEKKKMLSDISHDFKTPITVIKGYAEALKDDVIPEGQKSECIKMISDKSLYLSRLISEFSEYSKLDRADFTLKKEEINICEFARDYLIDSLAEIEKSGLVLDVDIPDEPIYCSIDAFQMRRVFENIIGNSIKYHKTGSTLYFGLESKNNVIIIKICDNGIGIKDELRENIFRPFTMENNARTEGQGTGLGMAIVQKIIESHNGDIKLLPKDKTYNTIFEITLSDC